MVCRSAGSGSCTAEFQQLPLSITVALNSQVSVEGSAHLASVSESMKKMEPGLVQTMIPTRRNIVTEILTITDG